MKWSRAFIYIQPLPAVMPSIDEMLDRMDKKPLGRKPRNLEAEHLDEGLHDQNVDTDDNVNFLMEIQDER